MIELAPYALRVLDQLSYPVTTEPLKHQIEEAFKDFVSAGYWSNLDYEDDLRDITTWQMCRALDRASR